MVIIKPTSSLADVKEKSLGLLTADGGRNLLCILDTPVLVGIIFGFLVDKGER